MIRLVTTTTAILVVFACCGDASQRNFSSPLSSIPHDSAGLVILELSHSLNAAARGEVPYETLIPDLEIGSRDVEFGHLADVTTLNNGRIAVLDRRLQHISLLDSTGKFIRRIGREGHGPGELTNPIALAGFGNYIVVLETNPVRPFTIFDRAGEVVGAASPPLAWPQDLVMHSRRGTLLSLDRPYQSTSEDWTRRLEAFDSVSFSYTTQEDERKIWNGEDESVAPREFTFRFDTLGRVVDTLASGAAPDSRNYDNPPGAEPQFDQSVWARRSRRTSGDGWVAYGHGRSSEVVILGPRRDTLALIRWPFEAREATDEEKRSVVLLFREILDRDWPNSDASHNAWQNMSRRERNEWIEFHKEFFSWPDTIPQLTAMYGAGACLWLAGVSSTDFIDGTALTWVIVNITNNEVVRVVRIPRAGSRVRHVDENAVFSSYRDDLSVHHIERFLVPEPGCNP